MDNFTDISTGNRKKFLDKARKKKEDTATQIANITEISRVQAGIRRFLHIRRANNGANILYMSKQQLFCQPSLIWENLIDKSSLLVNKKMHLLGIQYCWMKLTKPNQRMPAESSRVQEDCTQRIMEVLCRKISQMPQYFCLLSIRQREFWLMRILLSSEERHLPEFKSKQSKWISQYFLSKPLRFVQIFLTKNESINIDRELVQLICCEAEETQYVDFRVLKLEQSFSLENAYMGVIRCFWKVSASQIRMKNPWILYNFIDFLLNQMSSQCFLNIMEANKIDRHLLQSETESTEEIIKQKLEWLSFVDFLRIDETSTFLISFMNDFIEAGTYEQTLKMVGLATTIISLSGSNFVNIFKIQFRHFQIILEKLASWISIFQIQTRLDYQQVLLPYLFLLEAKLSNMGDRDFKSFFDSHQSYLDKTIKNSLLKIIYKVIFFKKPTKLTDKILKVSVDLLQNLYNKIFRTGMLSTEVFVNEALSNKLKFYRPGQGSDEISQFISKFPFIFPLVLRLYKFREFVAESRELAIHHGQEDYYTEGKLVIRKGHEYQDAFMALSKKNMRSRFRIQFKDQYGNTQRGIDAGGLTKQFINRVLKAIFNKQFGMFIENADRQLMPHPLRAQVQEGPIAENYVFIGQMIGKALYEGITIGPKFSGPFLNALIGKKNNFEDLQKVDKDLYNSLLYIKNMEEDAKDLELTFQYKDEVTQRLVNLKYRGNKIKVTNQNKLEYISLLTNYKVNRLLDYQSRHIRKGMSQMINQEWLYMFNYEELNYLISGSGEINVDELRKYTAYHGYTDKDQTIKAFWKVVKEMNQQNRSKLLMFVTSCPRPSFLGFKDLTPRFTLIRTASPVTSLPVAHTCSNVLELPDYKEQALLREKLLMAINSDSGFWLA